MIHDNRKAGVVHERKVMDNFCLPHEEKSICTRLVRMKEYTARTAKLLHTGESDTLYCEGSRL